MTDRVIDIGGLAAPEDDYEGPVLIIMAYDPGVATGWSAWKVPVLMLAGATVTRTVARCRHRYGTILRSRVPTGNGAGASFSRTDSSHVTHMFQVAGRIWDEWMPAEEDEEAEHHEFIFVMESFTLRRPEMDPDLLAPVRVGSIFMDRLSFQEQPPRMFFQSPSDALSTITDERLKRMGVYDRGSGAHARDASRHGILMIRRFVESRDIRTRIFGYDPLSLLSSS